MAGGLFAADRKFFFDIGGLDTDMALWGGENIDISIRVRVAVGNTYTRTTIAEYTGTLHKQLLIVTFFL